MCSVPACNNKTGYHLFPKDLRLKKLWEKAITAISRENFVAKKNSRLCRDHFRESDYFGYSLVTGNTRKRRKLKRGSIPSVFTWTNNPSTSTSSDLRHQEREILSQNDLTHNENTASKMEIMPCSEETLTEQCMNMIYNVFVYLKQVRKDLTRPQVIELTSEVTGITMGKVTQIVRDNDVEEDIVKDELDIGPTVLYKSSPSSFTAQEASDRTAEPVVVKQEDELQEDVPSLDCRDIKIEQDIDGWKVKEEIDAAQEMSDRTAEPVVVKQKREFQEDVPSLDSPETRQVDGGPLELLLPVKLEKVTDDFIKQEIDIGPTEFYKPSS